MNEHVDDSPRDRSLIRTRNLHAPRANVRNIEQSETSRPEIIVLVSEIRCEFARQQRQSYSICHHGNQAEQPGDQSELPAATADCVCTD